MSDGKTKHGISPCQRPLTARPKAVFYTPKGRLSQHQRPFLIVKTAKIGHFIGRFPPSVFYFADFFCHVFLLSVVHVYSSVVHEYAVRCAAMLVAGRAMRPQSLLSVGRLLLFCCKTMLFQIFFNKMCLILEKLRYFCIVLVERA